MKYRPEKWEPVADGTALECLNFLAQQVLYERCAQQLTQIAPRFEFVQVRAQQTVNELLEEAINDTDFLGIESRTKDLDLPTLEDIAVAQVFRGALGKLKTLQQSGSNMLNGKYVLVTAKRPGAVVIKNWSHVENPTPQHEKAKALGSAPMLLRVDGLTSSPQIGGIISHTPDIASNIHVLGLVNETTGEPRVGLEVLRPRTKL